MNHSKRSSISRRHSRAVVQKMFDELENEIYQEMGILNANGSLNAEEVKRTEERIQERVQKLGVHNAK